MNIENIDVKLTFSIPYGRANYNGTVCTEEAIENALKNSKMLPITFKDNSDDYPYPIGLTSLKSYFAEWDDKNQVCRVTTSGRIYNAGVEIVVKEVENNRITSFEIKGISIDK